MLGRSTDTAGVSGLRYRRLHAAEYTAIASSIVSDARNRGAIDRFASRPIAAHRSRFALSIDKHWYQSSVDPARKPLMACTMTLPNPDTGEAIVGIPRDAASTIFNSLVQLLKGLPGSSGAKLTSAVWRRSNI